MDVTRCNHSDEASTAVAVCEPVCERLSETASPSKDHGQIRTPDGVDLVDGVIRNALDHLAARRQRVRDPLTGRWTLDNGGRLETGLRSEAFWVDLEPARAEIETRVRTQLGLDDEDAAETAIGLAGAYAEARLIRRSEFLQLTRMETEPTTAKQRRGVHERRRRHLAAWALAFDRELKVAQALGLERKARGVPTLATWLAERAAAEEQQAESEAGDEQARALRGPRSSSEEDAAEDRGRTRPPAPPDVDTDGPEEDDRDD